MTAKTAKERDAAAQEPEETEQAEGGVAEPGRPAPAKGAAKKKVRRVRVIEVIDDDEDLDEDLDDVLEAVDAGEKAAAAASAPTAPVVPDEADDTDDTDVTEVLAEGEGTGGPAAKATRPERPRPSEMGDGRGGVAAVFGSPWFTTVLVALVLAAVASWALLQWHAVSAKESERKAVTAAAAKFGDVIYSYDPANVQAGIDANREMMAGDLLSDYMASTGSYKEFITKNKWTWSSKTNKVYLADMQGNLASAVIVINININVAQGPLSVTDAHFTLGMVKDKGAWKVSSLKVAGSESATSLQGSSGGLPNLSGSQGSGTDPKDQKK